MDEKPTMHQVTMLHGAIACIRVIQNSKKLHSLTPEVQASIRILEAKEECYRMLIDGNLRGAVERATNVAFRSSTRKIDIGTVEKLLEELYSEGMTVEAAKGLIDMVLV